MVPQTLATLSRTPKVAQRAKQRATTTPRESLGTDRTEETECPNLLRGPFQSEKGGGSDGFR